MDDQLTVLGVPMDLGADRRGVDMGPSAIRYGGLADELESLGYECRDGGDVPVPRPEVTDPDAETPPAGRAKFLAETREVCTRLADEVDDAVAAGSTPLVLGGDHSIAVGTVGGVARSQSVGILWFDAHGDLNTPTTTPSGNVHGMALAAILGKGSFGGTDWADHPVPEENVVLVGTRDLDEPEKPTVRDSGATVFTMTDIDARGITDVVTEAVAVATDGVDGVHLSFDLDFLDPTHAPGVGTPVRGGATYREAHAALERVHACETPLTSLELVEVNPILDEHNATAELAAELAGSALGKSIR